MELDGVLLVMFMAECQIVEECVFKARFSKKKNYKKYETLVVEMHAEGCRHNTY